MMVYLMISLYDGAACDMNELQHENMTGVFAAAAPHKIGGYCFTFVQ
jgi:hypothetical protein